MNDPPLGGEPHLADVEVERYATGVLPAERIRPFEEHYLDCPACLERVRHVQDLVVNLRQRRQRRRLGPSVALGAAAAGLAVLGLGLYLRTGWISGGSSKADPRGPDQHGSGFVSEAAPSRDWIHLRLESVQRGAAAGRNVVSRGAASYVLVSADASEAGEPGTPFDAAVLDGTERRLAQFVGLVSSTEGTVAFPLPLALLAPGDYVVELRARSDILRVPFRVTR